MSVLEIKNLTHRYDDKFISHGSINELLKEQKLDIDSLVLEIEKMYEGE